MKFNYWGKCPDIDGSGFDFRVDTIENSYNDVHLTMYFMPTLQAGYELFAVPEYTPAGWIFKHLADNSLGLTAVYEPIRDSIDPRDEVPKGAQLRVYVIKTIKQEYVEDER